MNPNRDLRILFSALSGAFLLLVGFTNVTDYATNFSFVQKVTRMEGLFTGEALRWRSIRHPGLHHLLYMVIILWELFCGCLAVLGAWRMVRARRSATTVFTSAGYPSVYAYGSAVALWFGGFVTVAGEWFLMWRSEDSDTQSTALQLSIVFLLFLLFHVAAPDPTHLDGSASHGTKGGSMRDG